AELPAPQMAAIRIQLCQEDVVAGGEWQSQWRNCPLIMTCHQDVGRRIDRNLGSHLLRGISIPIDPLGDAGIAAQFEHEDIAPTLALQPVPIKVYGSREASGEQSVADGIDGNSGTLLILRVSKSGAPLVLAELVEFSDEDIQEP